MKIFRNFLKERRKAIIGYAVMVGLFLTVAVLYRVGWNMTIYMIELWTVCLVLYGCLDFYKYVKRYHYIESFLKQDMITENVEFETNSPMEVMYGEIIHKLYDDQMTLISEQNVQMSEIRDYYAIWAHQIKTPIAAMHLMLQVLNESPEQPDVKALRDTLFQIDFYADAVMEYLRLEDASTDFVFGRHHVKKIIYTVVKKFSSQFINKKIKLKIECGEEAVYTDEKWLQYMIEQLISNAIKYTDSGGEITIRVIQTPDQTQTKIFVIDNGIGIREEDLPRIMERGYTGYNGRMDKKSSGIGLYLCKKAALQLGIQIDFQSKPGEGTCVCLSLKQNISKQ